MDTIQHFIPIGFHIAFGCNISFYNYYFKEQCGTNVPLLRKCFFQQWNIYEEYEDLRYCYYSSIMYSARSTPCALWWQQEMITLQKIINIGKRNRMNKCSAESGIALSECASAHGQRLSKHSGASAVSWTNHLPQAFPSLLNAGGNEAHITNDSSYSSNGQCHVSKQM